MTLKVSVHEREVAIVTYLHRAHDGKRTIRDMWEALQQSEPEGVGDEASLPTYHRTVTKLVRRGQLEEDGFGPDGAAQFKVAELLSPLNTVTLTDLDIALWELSAPEALAAYLDAVDYYEAHADKVLTRAAEGLLQEDPRGLILDMLKDEVEYVKEDHADLQDPETAEPQHWKRAEQRLARLAKFVHGELGLSATVWHIPTMDDLLQGKLMEPPVWDAVRRELDLHVFGDRFIEAVPVHAERPGVARMIVAGSDGSSHTGFVRGIPAPAYVEEEGRLMLTFNNSVAYVDLPEDYPQKIHFPFHGVPMTRSALEDPHNRGMIVSRPWYPDLTDSEFEHMKKAALDVVQFRVDERLVKGAARAYGTSPARGESGLLPKPNLLIRDGTVTPQEREFQHYNNPSAYGDIVREGIALSYSILKAVADSDTRVFAGAVKSTQLRTFSRIINWYVKRGSRQRFGKPIDPTWDIARVSLVTDSVAVTRLLCTLLAIDGPRYYRTCILVRPFPAMVTALYRHRKKSREEWLEFFKDWQQRQISERTEHGGEKSFLEAVELADDAYVRMVQEADYGLFYFGRPGGDPQITFPRFEFMDSLRYLKAADRQRRVFRAADIIMTGVHLTKWQLDQDHRFMTTRRLPRLVPYVVYEAHEKCKVLGHKLEAELRQAIASRLSQLKALRGLPVPKVDIEPVPLKVYISRLKALLPGGNDTAANAPAPGEEESTGQ